MNPTQSVNNESFNALPWQFEERVYTYINDLKYLKDTFKDIRFGLMDKKSDEYKTHWKGYTYLDEETNIWYVDINPALEKADFTVCHEIGVFMMLLFGFFQHGATSVLTAPISSFISRRVFVKNSPLLFSFRRFTHFAFQLIDYDFQIVNFFGLNHLTVRFQANSLHSRYFQS